MTKEQIKELMEKATIGEQGWKWEDDSFPSRLVTIRENGNQSGRHALMQADIDLTEETAELIAALPDIAKTALDALQRVEELEKELKDSKDIAQIWCDRSYALGYDPSKTP